MAEVRELIGIYNPITERHVKDIVGRLDTVYSFSINSADENSSTATRYGIKYFPTFLLMKNGAILSKKVGKYNINMYKEWVTNFSWDN